MTDQPWIPVEPSEYDEPHEVGLPEEEGGFLSPYDVPDGVRVVQSEKGYMVELRYLTDEEPRWTCDWSGLNILLGKYSNRIIAVEVQDDLAAWPEVDHAIRSFIEDAHSTTSSKAEPAQPERIRWPRWRHRSVRRATGLANHHVAHTVLANLWPILFRNL